MRLILKEELDNSTIAKFVTIQNNKKKQLDKEGNVQKIPFYNFDKTIVLYNLDVIISVVYRIKSKSI